MNKAAILILAASLVAVGDACAGVPSMPVDAACRAASTGPAMYDLCMRMLYSSPANSEVTTYAIGAAGAAVLSYGSAMEASERMLRDGSLPDDLRDACAGCLNEYGKARGAIAAVGGDLGRCSFADLRQGYMSTMAVVEDCTAKLPPVGGTSTPLYGMVIGDLDRTVLAFRLGRSLIA